MKATSASPPGNEAACGTTAFFRHVLNALNASAIPFLVGGAYALHHHTGIKRQTKDLDLFIRRLHYEQVSQILLQAGYETELVFPHWLAKIRSGTTYIDLIFSSGNGIAKVDDAWFEHADDALVLDIPAKLCPAEEMIWSKAFIMERERYDGADIAHLLRTCAARLDWPRLFRRFELHWRVLLCHLILFGFIYPAQRDLVPRALMDELLCRLRRETHAPPQENAICLGTLLSREQYLDDIQQQGFLDARLAPFGNMTEQEISIWTQAIANGGTPQ